MGRSSLLPTILLAVVLGGCSCSRQPEALPDDPVDNVVDIAPVNESIAAELPASPPVTLNVTNQAAIAEPPPTVAQDEQMRDDADATGLTARLPEDTAPTDAGNVTQPVDQAIEQK